MASLEELRQAREHKIHILEKAGMDPYPASIPRTHTVADFLSTFETLEKEGQDIFLSGRVMAIRGQGAILFAVLFDGTEKVQVLVKKDSLPEELFSLFVDTVDIGDTLSCTGIAMLSKTGEKSLLSTSWTMASKALLPLPEKYHGLTDTEERFRKRYLDLLLNTEARDLMYKKSVFWQSVRQYMLDKGYLEVETPTLETTTGGAEATPFKTHHNDFDIDVFLRISVGELWQKRLMAAGFPKTFEIGRVYRNEGSSPDHTQEFTNIEFYTAYMTFDEGLSFTEDLVKTVAEKTFGTLDFTTRGHSFSLSGTWPRKSYADIVREYTGVDVLSATDEEIENKLQELAVAYEGNNRERLTDTLWKYCRKQIAGPVWLVDVPKIVSPLAKAKKDNPELTLRAQLVVAGAELTNGFAELNDPRDQRQRFDVQKKLLEAGDSEAMMSDDEFVEMLEHGMPPTFGCGFGERLFAFLADKPLRELQTFPLMRPR